jgi:RHS repeat-associated protein
MKLMILEDSSIFSKKDQSVGDDLKPADSSSLSNLRDVQAHIGPTPRPQIESGNIPEGKKVSRPTIRYYHTDQTGVPHELTCPDGRVLWHAAYRAWGGVQNELSGTADQIQASVDTAVHQPLRFMGHYLDKETGLHCEQYRYYDPDVGRYAAQEAMGLSDIINPYQRRGR